MSLNNGIIKAPVRLIDDVKFCLGERYNDLGNLCRSNKINIWAKYKPFKSTKWNGITDNDRRAGKYGVFVPEVNPENINALGAAFWRHDMPDGPVYKFRLLDFNGYSHYSIAPFNISIPNKLLYNNPFANNIYIDIGSAITGKPEGNLEFNDVLDYYYGDWYPGIVTYFPGYNEYIWETADYTINNWPSDSVTIQYPNLLTTPAGTGDLVNTYGILSKTPHHHADGNLPIEKGTCIYLAERAGNGFQTSLVDSENAMDGQLAADRVTLLCQLGESPNTYIITTVEVSINNKDSAETFTADLEGYLDNSEGSVYSLQRLTNQKINANTSSVVRFLQSVEVYAPDGIVGLVVTAHSYRGYTTITSSKYDLINNIWIN